MPGFFRSAVPLVVFLIHATSTLGVTEPLRLSAPRLDGTQLRIDWTGGSGPFQLQDAPAPNGPWLDVGTAIPGTNTSVNLTPPQRFFRVSGVTNVSSSGGDAMFATLAAVQTFVDNVPTQNRSAWRTQILNFLNARADINVAGETEDGVWAITSDGIPLAIWNNRLPDPFDPEDVMPQAAALRTQTPGNTAARFATTVGAGFKLAGPRLSRQLGAHGYAPTFDPAPLESLKGRRNESVFFFNTHGGGFMVPRYAANGDFQRDVTGQALFDTVYGLWSGTKVDQTSHNHAQLVAELQAGRLGVCLATASYGTNSTAVNEWRYGITSKWVRHYMSFPPENHASIWLGACLSGSGNAAAMRSAFRAVGAEMVSGWTQNVNGESVLAATSFLYDRLLGANEVQPPATPQRPFSYDQCWTELRSKGLHLHPSLDNNNNPTTTEIIYEGAAGEETFGVFAPSIAYALINEIADQAHLIGIFGTPPEDAREVMIGGVKADVVSWETRKIICSLRRTGGGSAGDVQVIVHGLKSNVRQITRWTLNGAYKMFDEDSAHVIDGTLKLIFRADVGEYRKDPGNVFIRPTRWAVAGINSEVILTAKGIDVWSCGLSGVEIITWEGSGPFPTWDPTGNQVTVTALALNTIDQTGMIGLAFGAHDFDSYPLQERTVDCDGQTTKWGIAPRPSGPLLGEPLMFSPPLGDLLPDGTRLEYQLPGGKFGFSDWAIAAGSADSEANSGMKWSRAEAEFPPDPEAAR
ncbi:MAG TPA: hypothetical protein VM680_09340 [Verrucomicrobiae bacterium]|nr:hypothetical protein [Verrucomicrobiae bacterium]